MEEIQEEKFLTPEETKDLLVKEDTQKIARFWADTINKKARSNWFTTKLLIKKFKLGNEEQATGVMDLLVLTGFAQREIHNNEIKYKITLTKDQKITLLQQQLEEINKHKAAIESEIERLQQLRSTDTEK